MASVRADMRYVEDSGRTTPSKKHRKSPSHHKPRHSPMVDDEEDERKTRELRHSPHQKRSGERGKSPRTVSERTDRGKSPKPIYSKESPTMTRRSKSPRRSTSSPSGAKRGKSPKPVIEERTSGRTSPQKSRESPMLIPVGTGRVSPLKSDPGRMSPMKGESGRSSPMKGESGRLSPMKGGRLSPLKSEGGRMSPHKGELPRYVSPHSSMEGEPLDTPRSSVTKGPGKKRMLKFMIHEVRELKKQLDPEAKEIHIWKKRPSSRSSMTCPGDYEEEEEDDNVFTERRSTSRSGDREESETTKETSREVVKRSNGSEEYYMEKEFSKTETVRMTRPPAEGSGIPVPLRKKRFLPILPGDQSSPGAGSPVEVQILSQTYPPRGSEMSSSPRDVIVMSKTLPVRSGRGGHARSIDGDRLKYILKKY